jgi:hypothetical protein
MLLGGLAAAWLSGAAFAGDAAPFAEAEALFRREPRWLGGDAALSVSLGGDRRLWLFGDSFIATSPARRRAESAMVRNSVALQSGSDPRTDAMEFAWGRGAAGEPASFFPEDGPRWFWPGHGIRLPEGPLVLFLFGIVAAPDQPLGFKENGYALAVVDAPDAPLSEWHPRIVPGKPAKFDAVPATALVREGAYAVGLAIRQTGTHAGALVRYPTEALARGDLSGAEWWGGTWRGWLPEADLGEAGPAFVIGDAGAENSLHWSEAGRCYVHVASYGFGASRIGLRTAPALTGPWSPPRFIYEPPESKGVRPFVYAAKGHPGLAAPTPGALVITYVANAFEPSRLFEPDAERDLYWPRCIALPPSVADGAGPVP